MPDAPRRAAILGPGAVTIRIPTAVDPAEADAMLERRPRPAIHLTGTFRLHPRRSPDMTEAERTALMNRQTALAPRHNPGASRLDMIRRHYSDSTVAHLAAARPHDAVLQAEVGARMVAAKIRAAAVNKALIK